MSSWDKFPSEDNPLGLYKFTSIHFELNKSLKRTDRETYSLLDWLGDCGGLLDALYVIGSVLAAPFASFALNNKLISTMVRQKPKTIKNHS